MSIGFALWHAPGLPGQYPSTYPRVPGHSFPSTFPPNFMRDSRDVAVALGWNHVEGWNAEHIEVMWAGVNDGWHDMCIEREVLRAQLMGERLHWYVGPLYVVPQWQVRGVSSRLMRWGQEQILEQRRRAEAGELDAGYKETCCYLESAASARAVYLHIGFKEVQGNVLVWAPD
jgi:GNAT superfamily N-acetyltransferase